MTPFPYFAILKEAYDMTRHHRFLWLFGFFLIGTSSLNFGGVNWIRTQPEIEDLERLRTLWQESFNFLSGSPHLAAAIFTLSFCFLLVLITASGLAHAGLIWSAAELSPEKRPIQAARPEVSFRSALRTAKKYFISVIALQALITTLFLVLLALLAAPTVYFFALEERGRAAVLLLLGLAIFIPASVAASFINLYGPIGIVLYAMPPRKAILFAFSLLRNKLKETIILAALLAGISFLTIFSIAFAVVVISLPMALLALVAAWAGAQAAVYTLLGGTILVALACVIVFGAAFSAYQNVVWVLAVKHLVKLRESPEKAQALATEPVA